MELRLSSLRCLVILVFAATLVKCNEVQRIYQNRISVINTKVNVKTFEVIGLASVELEAGPSGSRPTYFFDCNTTLNNGTGITWPYDGEAPRFQVEPIPNSPNGKRLSILGITTSDLGVYTCLDSYTNTNVSINITQDNPAILPVNRVLRIMESSIATLRVYVSGYPLVTSNQIHWYRPNGTEILEGQALFEDGRRTLVLSEVQSADEGTYRCEVTTSYGNRSTLIQLDVYGQSPLRVYQGRIVTPVGSPVEVEVFPVQELATVELVTGGPTYYLDCNTSRNDGSGISWRKIDGHNRFEVNDISASASKRLSLARLNENDLGLYECFDNQSAAGDRAVVNITTDNPAVSAKNQSVEVLQGDQALLEVYVSGYPLVSGDHINWYWPNGSIIQESDASFMNDGRTLFLISVQLSDAGVYRCEVTLPGTSRNKSVLIQLDILTNSFILSDPPSVATALEWNNITLSCTASSVPLPSITWEKEGGATPPTTTMLTTLSDTLNSVTSVLTFSAIRYSDRGRYRCVADNNKTSPISSDYTQVTVTPRLLVLINVSGEPYPFRESLTVPNEADVILECFGSGDLQWMASNGQEIPSMDIESNNVYQVYVSSRDVQLLQIRNFSRSATAAIYTCVTDLTTQRGNPVEVAVTLHGDEVTVDTRTEPRGDSESIAAIIGGIVVIIILGIMLVLFASVILLIFIRRKSKDIVQISAVTFDEVQRSSGELSRVSSLKEKSELSEGSVGTETSIEKLEQNGSSTNVGTGQMNEYL